MSKHRDPGTLAYFEEHTPEYSVDRLYDAMQVIASRGIEHGSLVDIGCGAGNTLAFLQGTQGVTEVAGMDVSERYLAMTRDRLGCETYLGSIVDREFVDQIGPRFDFAVVAAVLHHLIGPTRGRSRDLATLALVNAQRVLKPGGHLVVVEPIFYPSYAMDAVFYLKKIVTRFTSERVGILGKWNNIGAPVVSYMTNEQLAEIVSLAGAQSVETRIRERELGRVVGRFLTRTETTILAGRAGGKAR